MEKIYLAIIIGYVLLKFVPLAWRIARLNSLMGYKRIFVNGLPFMIRKLSPLDFIEEKSGVPITFFNLAKGKTLWEQMQVDDTKNGMSEKEITDRLEMAKNICSKAVIYWPNNLKADDFFNLKINQDVAKIAWGLYAHVIGHNFPTFKKCFDIQRDYVLHVAELCAKFGKKPHEHIKHTGNLSDLEAYMIDEFFYTQLLIKENTQIQKQNEAIKKRAKK